MRLTVLVALTASSAILATGLGCSGTAEDTTPFNETGGASTSSANASGGSGASGPTSTTGVASSNGGSGPGGAGPGGAGPGGAGPGGSGPGGSGPGGAGVGGGGGGPPMEAEVYAHSSGVLYKLDPNTKAVTTVGAFTGCFDSVIDIAIDKNGLMYGTMFSGLAKIDKGSAACTVVASGSYPNSLSFVPEGTVDPNVEALVGYEGASYVRIDLTTGQKTAIGSLGNAGYSSSGDMVSLINGGSYLTVNGPNCFDCIVEVNPTTGALINVIGPLGYGSVFGLAYWGGVAYGFDDAGQLFQIDVSTGTSTLIPIPNAPVGLSFWGAGSTTAAPHM